MLPECGSAMPVRKRDNYHIILPDHLASIKYSGMNEVEILDPKAQYPRITKQGVIYLITSGSLEKALDLFEARFQEISDWLVNNGREADDIVYALATNHIGAQTALFVEYVSRFLFKRYFAENNAEVALISPEQWERILNIAKRTWSLSQKLVYFRKYGDRTIAGEFLKLMEDQADVAQGQKRRKPIEEIDHDLSWAWADHQVRSILLSNEKGPGKEIKASHMTWLRFARPEEEIRAKEVQIEISEALSPPDSKPGIGLLEAFRKSPNEPLKEIHTRIREHFAPPKSLPRLRVRA
jgi:hypothetical protein